MEVLGMVEHLSHTLDRGELYLLLLHDRLFLAVVLIEYDGRNLGRVS